ncbi:MAG: gamma-butyrobetaine hydroxylase-like domain-containing protein, partial [Halomonas sp.]|nr:gamma-butyrobetaine hydroxylase-like domain-containing protein [Halomonas sp.]
MPTITPNRAEQSHAQPRIDMGELASYADGPALVDAMATGARVTLRWTDDSQAHFPLSWLRDHCACASCRHPLTRERLFVPLEDIADAPEVELIEGGLLLNWADGHVSRFDAVWLHQRRLDDTAFAPDRDLPVRQPWEPGFAPRRIAHGDFLHGEGERQWLEALLRDGLV